jgi:ABC-type cobalamin/Fe3+-siderophores transport system ATPase subunit
MTVAVLGPDGAGKSTLVEGLRRECALPVRTGYMGLTGGALRHVSRLRVPGVMLAGRLLVLWGRWLGGELHALRGRVVVYDRYVYDAVAPTPYPLGPLGRASRWLQGRACPSPDLIVLLDVSGAEMYERKGEYDASTLEHWRQRFLALRTRLPRLAVVDATRPAPEVRAEVMQLVWRAMSARWRGALPDGTRLRAPAPVAMPSGD